MLNDNSVSTRTLTVSHNINKILSDNKHNYFSV